jgi:branched-chain amino acid transport system permease protein
VTDLSPVPSPERGGVSPATSVATEDPETRTRVGLPLPFQGRGQGGEVRLWVLGALGLILVGLIVWPFVMPNYRVVFLALTFMYVGLASSWNLVSGYTGYVSFGHAAFFGLGAYTAALLMTRLGAHWLVAVVAGGLLAALVAAPLGYILLRLRGPYFAIAMLGLAAALEVTALSWESLTRGGAGLNLPPSLNTLQVYFAMGITMLVVVGLSYRIRTSKYGLRLLAIREDEEAAETLGINTTAHKVSAFVLSATFPGVLGGLYAWHLSYIDPNSVFRPILSIGMVIMSMFGGVGTVIGPVLGGVVLTLVSEAFWANAPEVHRAAFGILIVLVVLVMPSGVVGFLRQRGLIPAHWRV